MILLPGHISRLISRRAGSHARASLPFSFTADADDERKVLNIRKAGSTGGRADISYVMRNGAGRGALRTPKSCRKGCR